MQNKKLYIIFTVVIIVVATAAFVGGRMLNGQAGPLGIFPMMGGGPVRILVSLNRAPELPTTKPEANGLFVERKDNTITVQTFSETGAGGIAVGGPGMTNDGPKVEVVVTGETVIYRDSTEIPDPPSEGETTVQQTVAEGSLDDLHSQMMVMVWGRKNGDRIIADVLVYTNPLMFKH
jgi:hypothetical protein